MHACTMSFQLNLPELHEEIATELLRQVKLVPHATTHTGQINLSRSAITLLLSGTLLESQMSEDDAHRLVVAGTSMMLTDHFPVGVKAKRRQIQKRRPRLIIRCVRRVANIVRRRCGGARSCRYMVGIACVVAVVLVDCEGIIGPRTAITFEGN